MDKERLFRFLDRKYSSKSEIIPNIPLGEDADAIWTEILQDRRSRGIKLPLSNLEGEPYWYILTNKMISASEVIVNELMEQDTVSEPHKSSVMTIEEIYYTGFMEGAQISIQDAMGFLQSGAEPSSVEELILMNSRQAAGFAAENIYHAIDSNFLHNLAYFLTEGLDNGGGDYRTEDVVEIPSLQGEIVTLPPAAMILEQTERFAGFLADTATHPLIKAAAAQAWILAYRPFPEGNERLARLLSNVILIRAGYSFFGNISISSVLAQTSYEYFRAIANILRIENGADLTYFLEYYLAALSFAVNEMKERRRKQEEEVVKAEQQLAIMPLVTPAKRGTNNPSIRAKHDEYAHKLEIALNELQNQGYIQFTLGDLEELTDINRKIIRKLLLPYEESERIFAVRKSRVGNIYSFKRSMPPEEPPDVIESKPETEIQSAQKEYVISALKERAETGSAAAKAVAGELLEYIQNGRQSFTTYEVAKSLDIAFVSARNALRYLYKQNIVRIVDSQKNQLYEFSFVPRNMEDQESVTMDQGYSAAIMDTIALLEKSDKSSKDRRIGKIIRKCLGKGTVTKNDYLLEGEETKWNTDMRFAIQLGLVKKINSKEFRIMPDMEVFSNLGTSQKTTLSALYEIFGDSIFSVEMAVAHLDYSSAHMSGILHQFTMLKLLDCTPNDDKTYSYQLNVNPADNPECFVGAA